MRKTLYTFIGICFLFLAFIQQGCIDNDTVGPGLSSGKALITLLLSKTAYNIGEDIKMTITAQNIFNEPLKLTFNDEQIYDFIVKKLPAGTEVWRWSKGKTFIQAIWSMTLEPGDKRIYSEIWSQEGRDPELVQPGTYQIEAKLSCEPEIFTVPLQVEILESGKAVLSFETIERGFFSAYKSRSTLIVKNKEDWERIWNSHTKNTFPQPPLPGVDFSNYMVIAAFRGEFTSSGYSTEVTEVINLGDKINVTIVETNDTGGMLLDVLTQPFHIIKLEKSDLPVNFIFKKIAK